MKVYRVFVFVCDFHKVYDCRYIDFKSYEAAKAAVAKELKERYSDCKFGRFDEDLIVATNYQIYVNFKISEKELEG